MFHFHINAYAMHTYLFIHSSVVFGYCEQCHSEYQYAYNFCMTTLFPFQYVLRNNIAVSGSISIFSFFQLWVCTCMCSGSYMPLLKHRCHSACVEVRGPTFQNQFSSTISATLYAPGQLMCELLGSSPVSWELLILPC